jgi:3-keto-disaccharide hydrolase
MSSRSLFLVAAVGIAALVGSATIQALQVKEYKSGIVWPEPVMVEPGKDNGPPSDAVVLFDGKDLSKWKGGEAWEIKDGVATAKKNGITTKDSFGDCQLHVEFATPEKVEGSGQGRGNSGVYMMERYEVQILDSWKNPTYFDGQCASIYKQTPPLVNASRQPGEWQSYDIIWEAPRFNDDGSVKRPAVATVLHNGVLVLNHFELLGGTFYDQPPKYTKHPDKAPIHLQYHGNPMRFRNIWIREIKPIEGKKPEGK